MSEGGGSSSPPGPEQPEHPEPGYISRTGSPEALLPNAETGVKEEEENVTTVVVNVSAEWLPETKPEVEVNNSNEDKPKSNVETADK